MPLSLNEIKDRALAFSRDWEGTPSERAEAHAYATLLIMSIAAFMPSAPLDMIPPA
jgi:hypothetical protein